MREEIFSATTFLRRFDFFSQETEQTFYAVIILLDSFSFFFFNYSLAHLFSISLAIFFFCWLRVSDKEDGIERKREREKERKKFRFPFKAKSLHTINHCSDFLIIFHKTNYDIVKRMKAGEIFDRGGVRKEKCFKQSHKNRK